MYEKIKKWYQMGLWTEAKVWDAVEKGILTAEQAADIISSK